MTGLKPCISDIQSNSFANWATTTARKAEFFNVGFDYNNSNIFVQIIQT